MKTLLYIPIILLFIIGCENLPEKSPPPPKTTFIKPIKKRAINLSNYLGEQFSILKRKDTTNYTVLFDKELRFSYIVRNFTDTIFGGTVTKNRELFHLNNKLDSNKYRIHTIYYNDTLIYGLEKEFEQGYILDAMLEKGFFKSAITDTNNIYELNADKKTARDIFRTILEKINPDTLISDKESMKIYTIEDYDSNTIDSSSIKDKVIVKAYPNPVVDVLNIETNKSQYKFDYQLVDINGKVIKSGVIDKEIIQVAFSDLLSGNYFVVVKDTKESVKIVKN